MLPQVDAIAAIAGVVGGEKFDVAVHGFARVAVHDDVDGGAEGWVDGFGMGAEEGGDEAFGNVVGNLFARVWLARWSTQSAFVRMK